MMCAARVVLVFSLVIPILAHAAAAVPASVVGQRLKGSASLLHQPDVPKQHLQICNAYVSATDLHVKHLRDGLIDEPLAFKACKEYNLALQEGDDIEFKLGDRDVGIFSFSQLPRTEATLLLVVQQRKGSRGAGFESHAFSPSSRFAQVAIIDAFQGASSHKLVMKERSEEPITPHEGKHKKVPLSTELPLNSVVEVQPGAYSIEAGEARSGFDARPKTSYVVLRVGNENQKSVEDVVVFPAQSDAHRLSAHTASVVAITVFSALFKWM